LALEIPRPVSADSPDCLRDTRAHTMKRNWSFGFLILLAMAGANGISRAQDTPPPPALSTSTVTAIPLEDVPMQADSAYSSLNAVEADLASDRATGPIKKDLPLISREINSRSEETSRLLAASPSLARLARLENGWHAMEKNFDQWQRDIARRTGQLEKYGTMLSQLDQTWELTLAAARNPTTPAPVLQSIQAVVEAIQQTVKNLETKRRELLVLEGSVTREDARVDREIERVSREYKEALDHIFWRDSPPIWKVAAQTSKTPATAREGQHSLATQITGLHAYAERQAHKFFIHAVILLVLFLCFYWMRRRLPSPGAAVPEGLPSAVTILEVPFAAAVILSLLASLAIYREAPRLLWAIWGAAALVPTVVIVRRLIAPAVYPILYVLVGFYALDQVREVVAVLPLVSRILFVGQMAAGALAMAWFVRHLRKVGTSAGPLSGLLLIASRVALILFVAAFFTDFFGLVNLGTLIGHAVLQSADLGVIFYALVQILEGLWEFSLHVGPISRLKFIQNHRDVLRQRMLEILKLAAWCFWGLYTLALLKLRDPLMAYSEEILNYNLALGSFSITPGHIVSFGMTIWLALLVSRFLRFILEEDIYPRFHVRAGLPYAISTLLHYVVLTIGFFLAVAALGFDMTKFTILAGAFGVGVGFGTQNIINNFVSGLIVLFERPIKVGDVIQVADASGIVERIGIRATTIRTTNGSEIVIPNGSLISNNVTNWTSLSGQREISLPVSVASGADPKQVMDLLKSVAAGDPRIAKDPAPQVYFIKYSPASLDFELRAWTEHVHHVVQLQSDLALSVNTALMKANLALK